jgi:hypothetical protein
MGKSGIWLIVREGKERNKKGSQEAMKTKTLKFSAVFTLPCQS